MAKVHYESVDRALEQFSKLGFGFRTAVVCAWHQAKREAAGRRSKTGMSLNKSKLLILIS